MKEVPGDVVDCAGGNDSVESTEKPNLCAMGVTECPAPFSDSEPNTGERAQDVDREKEVIDVGSKGEDGGNDSAEIDG